MGWHRCATPLALHWHRLPNSLKEDISIRQKYALFIPLYNIYSTTCIGIEDECDENSGAYAL